jgi:hypothetical protein
MSRDEDLLQVMFCCNDEHGRPQGFVERIDIRTDDGHELELESSVLGSGPVYDYVANPAGQFVQVGWAWFPIRSYTCHVGNYCWNAATMSRRTARQCVAHAIAWGFRATCYTDGNDLLPEAHRG